LVSNESNAPFTVILSAKSTLDYQFRLEPSEMELEPGGSGKLTITVKTDEGIIQKYQHHLKVLAAAKELGEEKCLAAAFSSVELIPRESGRETCTKGCRPRFSSSGLPDEGKARRGRWNMRARATFKIGSLKRLIFFFAARVGESC